jgi:uncharacterized membrane protein
MSTPMTIATLTAALVRRGVLRPDAPPPPGSPSDRPWFIGFVLGVSGWLAGIFGIIFIGMFFRPHDTLQFTVSAVLLLAAAYGLYVLDRENAFVDQLALALSIAGQIMAVIAIEDIVDSKTVTAAMLAFLQLGLVLAMPNRLARVISALFACLAWALAFRLGLWSDDLWAAADTKALRVVPAIISWLVIWVPLMALTWMLVVREAEWMASSMRHILRPALTGLLIALSLGTLMSQPTDALFLWSDTGQKTNWLVLWPLLSVGAAMLAALCALQLRNHALLGVAIAGALLHVLHFYFLLGTSLLVKSCIMIAIGLLLFTAGTTLRRRPQSAAEVAS